MGRENTPLCAMKTPYEFSIQPALIYCWLKQMQGIRIEILNARDLTLVRRHGYYPSMNYMHNERPRSQSNALSGSWMASMIIEERGVPSLTHRLSGSVTTLSIVVPYRWKRRKYGGRRQPKPTIWSVVWFFILGCNDATSIKGQAN